VAFFVVVLVAVEDFAAVVVLVDFFDLLVDFVPELSLAAKSSSALAKVKFSTDSSFGKEALISPCFTYGP